MAVICRFTPIWQSEWTWLGNVAFATDYANPHWITSHLWSLAVEEQFYLLWPFSLAWLLRRRSATGMLASLLAATAVVAAFSRGMGYQPFIGRIGGLSYLIYIWQMLFCTPAADYGLRQAWWLSFPLWLVSVFVVATLSYYGFERPLLGLRARFRHVALSRAHTNPVGTSKARSSYQLRTSANTD